MEQPQHEGIHPIILPDGKPGMISSYEILFEPVEDPSDEMTPEIAARHEALYGLVWDDPAAAIPELERVVKQLPHLPQFKNWLQKAYASVGRETEADAMGERLYREHPNYLFARLGKAGILLKTGELDKIKEFLPAFDLKLLYPDRSAFHISEAVALWTFAGILFHRKGEDEVADRFLQMLLKLAPEHSATMDLEELLTSSSFNRMAQQMTARHRRKRGSNRKPSGKPKRKRRP